MSKIERKYDELDGMWSSLSILRDNGRLQAGPFVLLVCMIFIFLGLSVYGAIDVVGSDWEQGAKVAVFGITFTMGFFGLLMVLVIRASKQNYQKEKQQ